MDEPLLWCHNCEQPRGIPSWTNNRFCVVCGTPNVTPYITPEIDATFTITPGCPHPDTVDTYGFGDPTPVTTHCLTCGARW